MPRETQPIIVPVVPLQPIDHAPPPVPVGDNIFESSVKGVWTFNQTVEDAVGQNDFLPSTGSVKYKKFQHYDIIRRNHYKYGLEFEEGKTYNASLEYSIPDNLTLSFWYYSPSALGFTRHITTRELEPKIAPIIAKTSFSTSSTTTSLSETSFVVTEAGYSKTENVIQLYMPTTDGASINKIILSEPFSAPGLHHVLITFVIAAEFAIDATIARSRIDIDGKQGIFNLVYADTLQHSGILRINSVAPGYIAHAVTQVGARLFDLVIMASAALNDEALKTVRYGYEHITYSHLVNTRFIYFGMSYAQPSTISVTNIFIDGGSVFATRSNGEIIKGSRTVWDKEYDYKDANSVSLLNLSPIDTDRTLMWTHGGIRLRGVSIKI